jgi:RNA polymerase sigma-B factor
MSLHLLDVQPRRAQVVDESERRAERTRRLFERVRRFGDDAARDELVRQFMPLARKLALRYRNSSQPIDDLVGVAHVGLVKAVDRFDPAHGTRFSSFAVPTMLGELRRHFRDSGWSVHVPRALKERAALVEAAARQLTADTGRPPSPAALSDRTGLLVEEVLEALDVAGTYDALSLDAPSAAGVPDQTLGDTLPQVDGGYELVEYASVVSQTISALTDNEREVLALRFGADLTQTEIAERVGVSQMQVSRLLRRTMERLRTVADANDP